MSSSEILSLARKELEAARTLIQQKQKRIDELEAELDRYRQAETNAQSRKTKFVFREEVAVTFPDQDGALVFDDPECEPESVCVIQCTSCGWNMYGNGWWGSNNNMRSEQIPRFCGHCGKEFDEEADPKERAE